MLCARRLYWHVELAVAAAERPSTLGAGALTRSFVGQGKPPGERQDVAPGGIPPGRARLAWRLLSSADGEAQHNDGLWHGHWSPPLVGYGRVAISTLKAISYALERASFSALRPCCHGAKKVDIASAGTSSELLEQLAGFYFGLSTGFPDLPPKRACVGSMAGSGGRGRWPGSVVGVGSRGR